MGAPLCGSLPRIMSSYRYACVSYSRGYAQPARHDVLIDRLMRTRGWPLLMCWLLCGDDSYFG